MAAKTDPQPSRAAAPPKKPRFAIFLATAAGLGYFPKAPGTFGSFAGIALAIAPMWVSIFALTFVLALQKQNSETLPFHWPFPQIDPILAAQIAITLIVAFAGVWAASRAAIYWGQKDPQRVVIDEVSGQHLALLLGCTLPALSHVAHPWPTPLGMMSANSPLNWKYLLVGFILFRLFDIWKPFPARQAESLPSGWGIMADDWIAGLYAAIGLWLARSAGL
jgi:phosphatidylglycerophosphatase A